jgi:hypothetical protein
LANLEGEIPRFIPHTKPTPPDQTDATGQVFFQIRTSSTLPDHSDRMQPPHNPSVVGSIPTGPTDFPNPGPVQSNLSDEYLVRCEIPRDLAKGECAFTRHSYREPRMLASFRRGVLASRKSVSKHPWC